MRRLLEDLSALCAQDGVTVESAAPDAIDGVSPRLLAATRAGSPAGEPILLRARGGHDVIAVVDGQGDARDIWEAIRVRTAHVMIRRRVQRDDLVPGLTAIAVKSDDRITVLVSESVPARLQRAGSRDALQAAKRAGWTQNSAPAAMLLFTEASLWRTTFVSGARRFAAAGSAALIIAVIIGVGLVLTEPAHPAPLRAVITPVTPSSTPHTPGASKRAVHSSRNSQTRVVVHRQRHGARTRTVKPSPTLATSTTASGTPTGSSPRPGPSSSPDPRPSPSPTRSRHCILFIC